jgi:parallel beta-helix repeat protein
LQRVIPWLSAAPLALALVGPVAAATYRCSPQGSDSNDGIEAPWRTLQKASAHLQPGDTLIVADGNYPGGVAHRRSGRPDAPITYRAEHAGQAALRGGKIGFLIDNADWIVLDGLAVREAMFRGVRVLVSHHVTVRNCTFAGNAVEGLISGYCNDLVLENNEAYGNGRGYVGPEGDYVPGKGHGIYVSSSGDRPVIRNNRSHDNSGCGLQVNGYGDPDINGRLRGIVVDHAISEAIIEDNVLYRNARGGGAGINMMSVRDSLIANNLLYHNLAGGIALFDDYAGEEWGCRNNRFVNNTVYFRPGEGRYGILFTSGSRGNLLRNNIILAGLGPAIEFDRASGEPDSDYNQLYTADSRTRLVVPSENDAGGFTLAAWQDRGRDRHSLNVPPEQTFISIQGTQVDFRLAPGAPAAGAGTRVAGVAALANTGLPVVDLGWAPAPPPEIPAEKPAEPPADKPADEPTPAPDPTPAPMPGPDPER